MTRASRARILGSVSRELLHETDRPVVVIPDQHANELAPVGS
jgi:nucleotide-binding universal stress UspA family protein